MKSISAFALAAAFLIALVTFGPPGVSAQNGFGISATATPYEAEVGQKVSVEINVANNGHDNYSVIVLQVYIYPMSADEAAPGALVKPDSTITGLGAGKRDNVTVVFTPREATTYAITVKVYKNSTESANWLDQEQISALFQTKAQAGEQTADPLITILIVAGAAAAIVVVVILIVLSRKKKRAVEEEAKTAVQPVVEEPVEQRPEGKFPKDYYKFRREKFSRLKPVGLTRSGTCILGNSANKEAPEAAPEAAPAINTCPKCGIQMERNWKTCHNCGAKSTIERAGEAVAKLEQHGGTVTHVREMLASAESSREARNYDEAETYAHDVLDRAKALLKKYEESQRPSEPAPSYSTDESATREEGAAVAAPAATGEEGARGYAESATGARGYKEPSGAKEYTEKTPAEACKPDKKEPNPCWKCGQGLRPEWKKCPYCNSPQEGICPSCGRTVKIRWNNCPHCRTDLTVEKPKLACPVCGAELPAAGECQSCKALLLRDSTARLVKEVKGKGADVTEAESLIGRGELALKIKNYDKAVSHFLRAEELAKKSRKDYRTKRLKDRLDQAETLMKDSAEEGADVGEARSVLAQARKALLDDNIEEGLSLTDKASAMAEESLSKATAAKGAKTTIPISVRKPVVVGDVKVKPRCPHCQEQVEESWTVCPFCQSDLTNRCPKCGASVKPGWKMCPVCESPLG